MYGAIETGGTKIICAKTDEDGKILDSIRFPTGEDPDAAVDRIVDYYKESNVTSIGIGGFGPLELDQSSENYGSLLATPKKGWGNYPMVRNIKRKMNIPILIDTDVNCACLAEVTLGAAKGLSSAIYITIGTGVGVGVYVNGDTVKGMMHPEAGHVLMRRLPGDDFPGGCPFHGDCFEGLVAGPALAKRMGRPAYEVPAEDPVWDMTAAYIGMAVAGYVFTYSPQKVILGGGVMEQEQMWNRIRRETEKAVAGYIRTPELENMEEYIVPAGLGGNQGILGAYLLAKKAL